MPEKNLPESYKSYSTKELLDMLENISQGSLKGKPRQKIAAMRELAREFQLTAEHKYGPKPHLEKKAPA